MFDRIEFPDQRLDSNWGQVHVLFVKAEFLVQRCESGYFGRPGHRFQWWGCRNRFWLHVRNTLLYEPVFDTRYYRAAWGDTANDRMARQELAFLFLRGV